MCRWGCGSNDARSAEATTMAGGGFVDTPNQRLAVRQVGDVTRAEDLARRRGRLSLRVKRSAAAWRRDQERGRRFSAAHR